MEQFGGNVMLQLVSNLGAIGFIFWLVHRTTTHTIPRLAKGFEDATAEQRKDFKEMLENQRQDFKEQSDKQRDSCMSMVREQRTQFTEELARERSFSKEHIDRVTQAIKEVRDDGDR